MSRTAEGTIRPPIAMDVEQVLSVLAQVFAHVMVGPRNGFGQGRVQGARVAIWRGLIASGAGL